MSRYIDVDNLIDFLSRPTGQYATCHGCCDIDCVDCIRDEVIKNLPIADVVEVVRCRDCKYFTGKSCKLDRSLIYPYGDDYCKYGERWKNNEK